MALPSMICDGAAVDIAAEARRRVHDDVASVPDAPSGAVSRAQRLGKPRSAEALRLRTPPRA
jgi:hypothetical protein